MYPKEIEEYVADLFRRRDEAVIVPRAVMHGGNWQPQPKCCHDNVDVYCYFEKDYKPVRGWLFFDYGYMLDRVAFLQHSILMFPDGHLLDITPSNASQNYPFLRVYESDEDFFAKEKYTDNGNLYYLLS
jgi:hypothetical protein